MAFNKVFHVENEAALADVAAQLAPHLGIGTIARLEGDLGAGKTAFARALIRHLSGAPALDVPSPTFTLLQSYDVSAGTLWHFDLYRLKDPHEIYELGWEDVLASKGIVLIEWAERIENLLPAHVMEIVIAPQADGTRRIEVST